MGTNLDLTDPADVRIPWPKDRQFEETAWYPPKDDVIVSADDHVLEPMNLWQERMPGKFRNSAPKLWRDEDGYHMEVEGISFDQPGFNSGLIEGREGIFDPIQRLADMDAECVDISIAFPQRALGLFAIKDAEKLCAAFDVYNEWFSQWCRQFNGRVVGVGVLPTIHNPEASGEYVQKLKDWGFKAMMIPSYPTGVRYNSSKMEPLFTAIEESGIPLSFHVGESGVQFTGNGALLTYITGQMQSFRRLWCTLVYSGILERHPNMKIVFTEGGASWVSSALYDSDRVYRSYETEARPKLRRLPSYYWHQNCFTTFMDDPVAYRDVDIIGEDKMLWSVDYPHPESTLGYGRKVLKELYETLPRQVARKIAGENAIRVWGLQEEAKLALAARASR
ncbi:MAG: amidohydrolase family protein [Pseudomonadales bacterium]